MQNIASEIEWLKQKLNENPTSMLHARLADRYLELKEVDRAIEHAEKSVALYPHYATGRYVLAKCYYNGKQFDRANSNLKEALATDPSYGRIKPQVMDPSVVTEEAIRKLGKKARHICGFSNRINYFILTRLLPRRIASRLANRVMKKMYCYA